MILELKAAGYSCGEIGDRLGLSERTVQRVLEELRNRARIEGDAMSSTHSSGIWDGISSPSIETLVVRYQADWRSSPEFRPDPRNYLPDDPRHAGLAWLLCCGPT